MSLLDVQVQAAEDAATVLRGKAQRYRHVRFIRPVRLADGHQYQAIVDDETSRWSLIFHDGMVTIGDRTEAWPGEYWSMVVHPENIDLQEQQR